MITGEVLNGEAVVARIENYPNAFKERLVRVINRLAIDLQRHVKADKLSGQVLKTRTGTLRRSINYKVTEAGDSVTASVGANTPYAHRQEYGFVGVETVRSYLRKLKSGSSVQVMSHTRNVNYPAHSFLRTALADNKPEILKKMKEAVKEK